LIYFLAFLEIVVCRIELKSLPGADVSFVAHLSESFVRQIVSVCRPLVKII